MSEHLFLEERRRAILEQLKRQGRVAVNELSARLHVSTVTIRQDLRALEEEGLLERTYGGAVLPASVAQTEPEFSFDIRQRRDQSAKAAIATEAAKMVGEGFSIAMDGSTTAFTMIPHLKKRQHLNIVTNSLMVAHEFLDSPQIEVFMPGGHLRRESIALVGRPQTLPEINLNIGFFGTRGISAEAGMTETAPDEAMMKRAMVAHCLSVVILADHTKWDSVAPFTFVELNKVDKILTDSAVNEIYTNEIRQHGVKVITVPCPQDS
ncbi:DeoR/GlpR family DNA-binding transcription regulator [Chloroflexota bacterium]